MNGLNYLVIGLVLVVWIGLLSAVLFRRGNRLVSTTNNVDILLPIGIALAIWMWIFALVVFSA